MARVSFLLLLLVGCDSTPSDTTIDPDPELDALLEAVITHDGQRGLSVFRHPRSDDLAAIPADPRNPLTPEKVRLGGLLFHDSALGTRPARPEGHGTYSCATCHHAGAGFQAGRRQALGDGGSGWGENGEGRRPRYAPAEMDVQPVRSPSVLNVAYQDVMLWDGSLGALGQNAGTDVHWDDSGASAVNRLGYDGVESQAIVGLTNHRLDGLEVVESNETYRSLWQAAFPGDSVSVERAGLAIAAYERTLFASQAPFQRWLAGERSAMTDPQKRGAVLFFGDAGCETCHTGPALSGPGFYALGMPDLAGPEVIRPDAPTRGRGGFLADPSMDRKFKVPQLYNLADSPFLGHGASFLSILEVVQYYNRGAPDVTLPPGTLEPRFRPLALTVSEVADLTAFIEEALRDPDLRRYVPNGVPSGACIPANDLHARIDLGC